MTNCWVDLTLGWGASVFVDVEVESEIERSEGGRMTDFGFLYTLYIISFFVSYDTFPSASI